MTAREIKCVQKRLTENTIIPNGVTNMMKKVKRFVKYTRKALRKPANRTAMKRCIPMISGEITSILKIPMGRRFGMSITAKES